MKPESAKRIEILAAQYEAAKRTDDFETHHAFTKALKASNDLDIVDFHYGLLRDRANRDLYLRVRAAFDERGPVVGDFLAVKATVEKDPAMCADILHLLGLVEHAAAVPMARESLKSPDTELRRRACYVIGWLGQAEDIPRLREVLLHDTEPSIRATAATSHYQFYEHAKRSKMTLLRNLHEALPMEKDREVSASIVLAAQYILERRFGIKWDREEDELRGDVEAAREKCMKALARVLKE
jgi:HEAT repeat protein